MILRPDRRRFLVGSLGGLAVLMRPAHAAIRATERTLVLVQLSGGNDGLSTLIPYADDGYASVRNSTRFEEKDVLKIDERVGLHPELRGLQRSYQGGQLAFFEGVGYPDPNRSHFRSLDIWHAADPAGRSRDEGWIGRLAGQLEHPALTAVVHVGPRPPFALQSRERPPIVLSAASLSVENPAAGLEPIPSSSATGSSLDFVRGAWRDAHASAAILRDALARPGPGDTRYPDTTFGQDLRTAAGLIHAEIGLRVCSLELGGFDTHSEQRSRHSELMQELDAGLTAFLRDLGASAAGRETLVLAFSEFGRRVAENGSRGHDHGAAGLMLALGHGVRGGLFGAPPSLEKLVRGDPVHTTDFRSVYGRAIEHCFGLPHEKVLDRRFPLQDWV